MKVVITESKINDLIKDYLMNSYDLLNVEFTIKSVGLGSGPNDKGETSVEQNVIKVYVNNVNDNLNYGDKFGIKRGIIRDLESMFGADFKSYGSSWSIEFFEVIKKPF